MKPLHRLRTRGLRIAVRVIADIMIVNAALLFVLGTCCLTLVDVQQVGFSIPWAWQVTVSLYLKNTVLLTPISLIVFAASGFYTRARAYRGRYKVSMIAQAVSLSYLIFGFVAFLAPGLISMPRSAWLLAWFLTIVVNVGARLGPYWLRSISQEESRLSTALTSALVPTEPKVERVLVTGGAGYLGSTLIERLLHLGYNVRVLDCLLYGEHSIRQFYRHPRFELIRGDIRDVDTVVQAAQGMDAVVHLAALVGDPACALDEELTVDVNYRAPRTIARVSRGLGIQRFVFASTCSVYGASDEFLDERSALNPISLYARTKLEAEKELLSMGDGDFAPVILRFATIYGLSPRPRFDLVVNLLTAKAIQEGRVGIFGGQQWRPLVHVRDVSEAIARCLQAPLWNVRRQIFNVGSNEQNYQVAELGRLIQEMVPKARVETIPNEDNRNYRVCFDKIHNVLNFEPRYTVRDGIQEIVDAYAAGYLCDYRDPSCSNLAYLSRDGHLDRLLWAERKRDDWARLALVAEPSA